MPRKPEPAAEAETEAAQLAEALEAKRAAKAERLAAKAKAAAAEAAAAEMELETPKAKKKASEEAAEPKASKKAAKAAKEAEEAEPAPKKRAAKEVVEEAAPPQREKRRKVSAEAEDAVPAASEAVVVTPKAFRKAHEIIVDDSCPAPMQSFEAAQPQLGKALISALKQQGYGSPTPIQAQGWPIALQGRDMVAVAKTGSGKTCGFLLPALARIAERGPAGAPKKLSYYYSEPAAPSALVLAPTRELAQQIAGEAAKFAPAVRAKVVSIYGGVPKGDQVRELRLGCDVLIATPGRLIDLSSGDAAKDIKPAVTLSFVTYLVLDEADRMLDMGFEPDIRKIVDACPKTGRPEEGGGAGGPISGSQRQTLFFTATWPKAVEKVAWEFTSRESVQVRIGQGAQGDKLTANTSVEQIVHILEEGQKRAKLREVLKQYLGPGETCIVFAAQKHGCDELCWDLQKSDLGAWCQTIHSGKYQADRDQALAKFRKLTADGAAGRGERGVLVATDVAARGLDIPGVALVVVYDFGRSLHSSNNGGVESYVHRIGRTGRAGKTGRAITFFTSEDQGSCELVELLKGAGQAVPAGLEALVETESNERWEKERKQSRYKKGGGSKGKGKGGGKGKGKGASGGRGSGGKGKSW